MIQTVSEVEECYEHFYIFNSYLNYVPTKIYFLKLKLI